MVLSIKLKQFYDCVFFQHHAARPHVMLGLNNRAVSRTRMTGRVSISDLLGECLSQIHGRTSPYRPGAKPHSQGRNCRR